MLLTGQLYSSQDDNQVPKAYFISKMDARKGEFVFESYMNCSYSHDKNLNMDTTASITSCFDLGGNAP